MAPLPHKTTLNHFDDLGSIFHQPLAPKADIKRYSLQKSRTIGGRLDSLQKRSSIKGNKHIIIIISRGFT